jgi:hypothetical protein
MPARLSRTGPMGPAPRRPRSQVRARFASSRDRSRSRRNGRAYRVSWEFRWKRPIATPPTKQRLQHAELSRVSSPRRRKVMSSCSTERPSKAVPTAFRHSGTQSGEARECADWTFTEVREASGRGGVLATLRGSLRGRLGTLGGFRALGGLAGRRSFCRLRCRGFGFRCAAATSQENERQRERDPNGSEGHDELFSNGSEAIAP